MRINHPNLCPAVAVAIAVLSATATLAACKSSGPSDAGAATANGKAPIKIMTIGEFDIPALGAKYPQWSGAVDARVEEINANGGLNGHQVQLTACNLAVNPNNATACVNKAIAQKVAAVVGVVAANEEPQIYPALERAGIAVIGGNAATTDLAFTSTNSFPLTAGADGFFYGLCKTFVAHESRRISLIITQQPGVEGPIGHCLDALKGTSTEAGATVIVPNSATDMSSYVAKAAAGGTDGVVVVDPAPQQMEAIVKQLRSQAPKAEINLQDGNLPPSVIKDLGGSADGIFTVSYLQPYTSATTGATMYRSDMAKYESGLQLDGTGESLWAAAWVFERVARSLSTVTSATVLAAMSKLSNFDMGGLSPNLTTTSNSTAFAGLPRMYNPTVGLGQIKAGQLVSLEQPPLRVGKSGG